MSVKNLICFQLRLSGEEREKERKKEVQNWFVQRVLLLFPLFAEGLERGEMLDSDDEIGSLF
jgi:hypothetical protein